MARPTGDSAKDRLNLFLSIVPFVLSRKIVTVADVAAHFGTTQERVVKAIKTIACDGAENEARYNFNTELFQIDWDDLDDGVINLTVAAIMQEPARFSNQQRAMFVAGLELLRAHPAYRKLPEFDLLLEKLRGKDASDGTGPFGVVIDANNTLGTEIQAAIESSSRVTFDYVNNRGDSSKREVDPYRLEAVSEGWYLRGYCHNREEMRTFSLVSMSNFEALNTPIEDREIDPLALYGELFNRRNDDLLVTIEIEKRALPLIAGFRQPGESPKYGEETAILTIPFTFKETAAKMMSGLPGLGRVVEPAEVREEIFARATAALKAYRAG